MAQSIAKFATIVEIVYFTHTRSIPLKSPRKVGEKEFLFIREKLLKVHVIIMKSHNIPKAVLSYFYLKLHI